MWRDLRVDDNWALLYAMEQAEKTSSPLAVACTLAEEGLPAARHFGFMVRGLQKLEPKLKSLNIPFFLLEGSPVQTLPSFVDQCKPRLIVMDYSPLRFAVEWKSKVKDIVDCGIEEVDAHNIVPVWIASSKLEFAARTIRPKIQSKLDDFLIDFPHVRPLTDNDWPMDCPSIDWDKILTMGLETKEKIPEVDWAHPGEEGGQEALQKFLDKGLSKYAASRNDPSMDAQSGLSPYLNFGFLSAQRTAFEAEKFRKRHK